MKTVVHVGKFYPPVPGGMERVVQMLCRASRGLVESRVLALNTSRATSEDIVEDVPVTRVGTLFNAGSVPIAPELPSRLRRIAADLIVFHEPNPWALLSMALARPSPPVAVWYHSDVVRPPLQYALFYAPIAKPVYGRAVRFIVSSPPLGEHAAPLAQYRSKIRVIPFGVDTTEWQVPAHAGAGPGEPFVLFAGRHVAYKGVDVLLRALAGSRVRAVIAGDGPRRSEWETLSASLGLNGRVRFTGDVSDDDLRALFHQAAALVLPSVTRAEAFGFVQLEAMACGKPVISTDVPSGVSWVNQDGVTGLVVPAGDDAALRAAIDRVMGDAALREAMGARGRRRVDEEFSMGRLRDRLRSFYAELGLVSS